MAITAGFALRKEYSYLYNVLAMCTIYLGIIYMEFKLHFKIKNYIKVLLIITFILHTGFGQYFHLYTKNNWFDKGLHLFGSVAFSLFFYAVITALINIYTSSRIFIFIVVSSIGITAGVFFELIEFTLDISTDSKHQHGLIDTNLDLIFNILGAYIAGTWVIYNESPLSIKIK
ncbi:hypothetical protein [Anaerosolibacter sp.]|uniref:hypothetical protein n=1 Tax=Anaerosolibacter sp. TaxID=1872527 RepID=UPI0039EE054A